MTLHHLEAISSYAEDRQRATSSCPDQLVQSLKPIAPKQDSTLERLRPPQPAASFILGGILSRKSASVGESPSTTFCAPIRSHSTSVYINANQTIELTSTMLLVIAVTMKPLSTLSIL